MKKLLTTSLIALTLTSCGSDGKDGANGAAGEAGPKGEVGARGANGINGANGNDGGISSVGNLTSPYIDLCVDEVFFCSVDTGIVTKYKDGTVMLSMNVVRLHPDTNGDYIPAGIDTTTMTAVCSTSIDELCGVGFGRIAAMYDSRTDTFSLWYDENNDQFYDREVDTKVKDYTYTEVFSQ